MSVHEYGRGFFLVDSHSRKGMKHLVDVEPELDNEGHPMPHGEPYQCSCESFALRVDRPCRHCIEVFEYLLPIFEHLSHWKTEVEEKPKKKRREYTLHEKPIPAHHARVHSSLPGHPPRNPHPERSVVHGRAG